MRSTILIFLAILTFATTPAGAQGTWLETRLIRAVCGSKATSPANTDRLAKRLNLTDTQKAALKDLAEASASAAPGMSAPNGISRAPVRVQYSRARA